jgi:hypothetical protein
MRPRLVTTRSGAEWRGACWRRAFLGRDQQQVARQVKAASRLLRTTLRGADVDRMIEEDPLILFTEISSGAWGPASVCCRLSVRSRGQGCYLL